MPATAVLRNPTIVSERSVSGTSPFVFVVGCPRSGTTLLQRMLDNHPLLAVANDTHFIPRALDGFTDSVNPDLTPALVERVRSYHRFDRLGVSDEAINRAAMAAADYRGFVSGLYGEFARTKGKPLGGEKTPDYVRRLPLLHELFPSAKIIHIIRDGRDVALSLLDWATEKKGPGRLKLWSESPLGTSALWWAWQVSSGRDAALHLGPDSYCEVLYESLVAEPQAELQRLASLLDLPYSDAMARFHEGKKRTDPKLSAKKAWLPATSGLRDWRRDFSADDLALFESLSGELLGDLGYELRAGSPSTKVRATADQLREMWRHERS